MVYMGSGSDHKDIKSGGSHKGAYKLLTDTFSDQEQPVESRPSQQPTAVQMHPLMNGTSEQQRMPDILDSFQLTKFGNSPTPNSSQLSTTVNNLYSNDQFHPQFVKRSAPPLTPMLNSPLLSCNQQQQQPTHRATGVPTAPLNSSLSTSSLPMSSLLSNSSSGFNRLPKHAKSSGTNSINKSSARYSSSPHVSGSPVIRKQKMAGPGSQNASHSHNNATTNQLAKIASLHNSPSSGSEYKKYNHQYRSHRSPSSDRAAHSSSRKRYQEVAHKSDSECQPAVTSSIRKAVSTSTVGGGECSQLMEKSESWDAATTVTTATSQTSSMEHLQSKREQPLHGNNQFDLLEEDGTTPLWDKWFTPCIAVCLILLSIISPALFVGMPRLMWTVDQCDNHNCVSEFITLSCKLILLMIGCWALFLRKPKTNFPAKCLIRTMILTGLSLMLGSFWLFYLVRIVGREEKSYQDIVVFTNSTADCLLFYHYVAVAILELRGLRKEFIIKVVRSTDGESKFYTLGRLSLQQSAAWVLEQYYKDFTEYNPYTQNGCASKSNANMTSSFKLYDIDGVSLTSSASLAATSRAMIAAAARRRDSSRNERFYEEQEYERKVGKRRARLLVAADEAFAHIRRASEHDPQILTLGPHDVAQAIFPSLARPLQKYFKATGQTHRHTVEAILDHLGRCLSLEFTPQAFLEKYLKPGPVITSEEQSRGRQHWEILTDLPLNRSIKEGVVFQLKQEPLSLIVYVARLPRFSLHQQAFDPRRNQFVLKVESEAHSTMPPESTISHAI